MFAQVTQHRQNNIGYESWLNMVPSLENDSQKALPATLWTLLQIRSHLIDPLSTIFFMTQLLGTQTDDANIAQRSHAIHSIESSAAQVLTLLDELITYA